MTEKEAREAAVELVRQAVCRDRAATHGDVEDNFRNIADLWEWWLKRRGILPSESKIEIEDVAQMMSLLKVARKISSWTTIDHWLDDAGYNLCAASAIIRREACEKSQS